MLPVVCSRLDKQMAKGRASGTQIFRPAAAHAIEAVPALPLALGDDGGRAGGAIPLRILAVHDQIRQRQELVPARAGGGRFEALCEIRRTGATSGPAQPLRPTSMAAFRADMPTPGPIIGGVNPLASRAASPRQAVARKVQVAPAEAAPRLRPRQPPQPAARGLPEEVARRRVPVPPPRVRPVACACRVSHESGWAPPASLITRHCATLSPVQEDRRLRLLRDALCPFLHHPSHRRRR